VFQPWLTSLAYTGSVRVVFINSGLDSMTHLSTVFIPLVNIFVVQLLQLHLHCAEGKAEGQKSTKHSLHIDLTPFSLTPTIRL
jgi:hypothetical protein